MDMCRLIDCLTHRVVATFLVAALAGGVAWGTYEWANRRTEGAAAVAESKEPVAETKAEPKAKPKSEHPPISELRDRMLVEFHGEANHTFASLPGFGMERMMPLYKKVPFEVPYFSTGDLEAAEGPKETPKLLQVALAKTHEQFEKITPAPPQPSKRDEENFPGGRNGWGSRFNNVIAYGVQLRMLDLVGLTDLEAPKVYVGGNAFELTRLAPEETKELDVNLKKHGSSTTNLYGMFGKKLDASVAQQLGIHNNGRMNLIEAKPKTDATLPTRGLDIFETAGVQELLSGKDTYIRTKDSVVRMLGALRATDQCVRCHTEAKQGDLLGAFSYVFVDANGSIRDNLKKK
jgi:hypothetical protein